MTQAESTDLSPLATAISQLEMREIGPAFMGGRIADIAIHPTRPRTWYLAVGSGGMWKTTNAGTTWRPLFDEQPSYSIGCVTIDPNQPDVIWVGTGEAVSGRHVAWGDGVYRSLDGGASWQQMGLARSEHISEIVVDPRDSNTIFVAAEGPLWSSGGDRGVYKSTNGGKTWQSVLPLDADTGATALAFAPDNPDVLYAAAYQRRRRVWGFLAGGPGSAIYKSVDGGTSWRKITQGLPTGDMGRIGLAVTPADPNVVYATIEADEATRGFYRSTDRGESWEKRNDYLSGGTGPHYYQEIYASPVDADRVYQVDVFVHWTHDGGKTIARLETGKTKHSDNHLIWIDPADGDHLLVGADAGLYETFDHGETFRHVPNLPISQFYRVAADNSLPFYNILAGAQDLGTLYGPARTTSVEGVRNQDWTVTLGADGYHVAFDPDDPDICYMEWQNGNVMRMNRRTMQLQDIQPQGTGDDPPERWNWDCPIVVSPHDARHIFVASQRVWRSDDRGDSWTPISGDLTRNINRYELPIAPLEDGGLVRSIDALWDHRAMSGYSTITHLSESPVEAGLIYVGTDDGLIHVTEDGGSIWRQVGEPPELPADAFISNVVASPVTSDVVFAVADAHKSGDYSPYIFESNDRGASWRSIVGDLPEGTIVWSLAQDHVNTDLLFIGAEFGLYVSVNRGENWHKLGGVPTISFRDLELQRRDDDLIGATFGRGIYLLDDYSPLRHLDEATLANDAALFPVRDAWWYVPHQLAQAEGQPTLGSTAYAAKNPDFGACFTYHLHDEVLSATKKRRTHENEATKDGDDVEWPGWQPLWDEHVATTPRIYLVVSDANGQTVRRIEGATTAGLHRTSWDLRLPPPDPIKLDTPGFKEPWEPDPIGPLVAPGRYSVELIRLDNDGAASLSGAQSFEVKPTPTVAAQPGHDEAIAFHQQVWQLQQRVLRAVKELEEAKKRVAAERLEIAQDPASTADDFAAIDQRSVTLEELSRQLSNDPIRERLSEATSPSIKERVGRIASHLWQTTQSPTNTQRASFTHAEASFNEIEDALDHTVSG